MKLSKITDWITYWQKLQTILADPKIDEAALDASLKQVRQNMPLPVFWFIGKTQAGKTSIIHALTGSETAEIGNGLRACTRFSSFYDFPQQMPVVRFLDTRGLGEIDYDPNEDIHYCESRAHLLIAVMKVADLQQQIVLKVLQAIRIHHPDWPIIMVQTGLHELYGPHDQHLIPWPFDQDPLPQEVPTDLQRALHAQRQTVIALPGSAPMIWVPVDLTLAEDGFSPTNYGLEPLWKAIELVLPLGLQRQLAGEKEIRDLFARTAHQHIVGYSLTAAGLGTLPVVDLVMVTTLQAKLLRDLAKLYGQDWNKQTTVEFFSLLGTAITSSYFVRIIGRTLTKFIPGVGQTVGAVWGASASAATTFALGKAAVYFFTQRQNGLNISPDLLRKSYADALEASTSVLKQRI
ncbi:MAG: DUF697 domain-containing protein [Nitrosomonas sp.]|nr:DUF697 domain-containing protein [Nitrosomonas sp.]